MDVRNARTKKRLNKVKHSKTKKRAATTSVNDFSSDEVSNYSTDDDCLSVHSMASSTESSCTLDQDLEDTFHQRENFEFILLDNIEGARQKGAKNRQTCLLQVKNTLCHCHMSDVIMTRKETILDFVENLLRKGLKEDGVVLASGITCALCIQLGEAESLQVFTTLKPILISIVNDDTALSSTTRASAASALGLSCFIGAKETDDIAECLTALKAVFSKKIPADPSQHIAFTNALLAWGLLLTISPQYIAQEQIEGMIAIVCKILERGDLHLRIAAGETIALVFEVAREMDFSLRSRGPINNLHELLRGLANESGRRRGKREKKQQKSSFREILHSVEEGCTPEETIRFSDEYITMTSWTWVCRYNAFKDVLGSGTNTHLETNMLLREIFELGVPVSKENKTNRLVKCERQLFNAVSSKERKQTRNERRDKKHSVLSNSCF